MARIALTRFIPKNNIGRFFGKQKVMTIVLCALAALVMVSTVGPFIIRRKLRKMSIYLGDGDCEWTEALNTVAGTDIYGTLFASYPGSGMRITWQQTEGLTGIRVYDDFFQLATPKIGLVKTQYPHYEGIWSYGNGLDQVILVIRNPRWAMPSYLTLLSELEFAHTWQIAYGHLPEVFTKRADMDDWIKWRDYRFADEIRLWGLHIDFYMENGAQYWMPYDFERNGQWPFRFYNASDEPWPQDYHCAHDVESCYPRAIVSYERLKDPIVGPTELKKIAAVLRNKTAMTVMPDDGINCVWHDTWIKNPYPNNDDRDKNGLPRTAYNFTLAQMYVIEEKLVEYKNKYSTGRWEFNTEAIDLVQNFEIYIGDVRAEIDQMEENPPPTGAPNANYTQELVQWYNSKGKGNRYSKGTVQNMGIWDLVKHLYDDH